MTDSFQENHIWQTDSTVFAGQTRPENEYLAKAYDFIKSWQSGQTSFGLQTSGSTGSPKVIALTRHQLRSSASMTGRALKLGAGTRALVCLNVEYIAGVMMLVRGMELGWKLTIIPPVSNPLKQITPDISFDFVAMVPMQLSACLDDPETRTGVGRLGKVLLGGAPIGVQLLKQIKSLCIPVYQSYGMTETVSHVALRKLNGTDRVSAYQFLPGVTAGLDERGCLHVSGEMTNGELVQTNDLVEMNSDHEFTWLGRYDNVINSGGVKIILDRLDDEIALVFDALYLKQAYFSWYQEDERLGQKLILFVEGKVDEETAMILINEIRKRVSAYQTPKHVYFVNRFEKTPTNKIDKRRTAAVLFNNFNG